MAEIYQGTGWKTEKLLRGLEASDNFYLKRLAVIKLDFWSKGRVVLIKDAAYCLTAMTGMETTSAMVETYILAGEIEKHCVRSGDKSNLLVALKKYN
jgi:2-polyprenyl-6-methoxyphenol hydroxylase-like FAD-dependent oxidoreductase